MTEIHIGTTIYIAAAAPATVDATGFQALTYTKVSGAISGFQFGETAEDVAIGDLETGQVTGKKGASQGQTSTAQFRKVAGDAGQVLARTTAQAAGDASVCSVKMVKGSGANAAPVEGDPVEFATGYLSDYILNQPTSQSFEGFSVNFRQNGLSVAATEPAA